MTKAPAQRLEPRIPASELKDRLLTFARATGFDSCRITTCGSPPHKDEFQNWLDEGGHGEMSYMERGNEKRCDPQKLLPKYAEAIATWPHPAESLWENFDCVGSRIRAKSLQQISTDVAKWQTKRT